MSRQIMTFNRMVIQAAVLVTALMVWLVAAASPGRYLDTGAFLRQVFGDYSPLGDVVWIEADLRTEIEQLLARPYSMARVRYWRHGERTAWILDEIGKEQPITIGVAIDAGRVSMVRILEFRESRGWEVRYPFFTDQFDGAQRAEARDGDIGRAIDGITGATLSVRAVAKAVELALLLEQRAYSSQPALSSAIP